MKLLDINMPDRTDLDPKDMARFLAAKLYESGRLTLSQAAQMVGIRTVDFAEVLSQYGVSLFNYPASDIANDVAHA